MRAHPVKSTSVFRKGRKPYLATAIVSLIIALCTTDLSAQVFAPFRVHTKALYTTAPEAGHTSSLYFTASGFINADSIFLPAKTFDPSDAEGMIEPGSNNCEIDFWGSGGNCHLQNVSMWLGSEMRKIGDSVYRYATSTGEHLFFDFDLAEGESALVYENSDFQLLLVGEGEGTGTYLGIDQNTANYRLEMIDTQGNAIESPLNNAPITLSAELGAIDFMRIDSFPQIMQPVTLAGHVGAEAGVYTVKASEIYDFEEGEVFQYYRTGNYDDPFVTESYYETRTAASRSETESEIIYTFNIHRFKIDGSLDSNFTETQTVSKNEHIADVPFEIQEQGDLNDPYFTNGFKFQSLRFNSDICGSGYSFTTRNSSYYTCPPPGGTCYGNPQNIAPGEWQPLPAEHHYSPGMGEVFMFRGWEIVSEISGSETNELIYALKNGEACGEQVILSTSNHRPGRQLLKLYPNPASSHFRIEMPGGTKRLQTVELHDIQGRHVRTWPATQSPYATDGLPAGMYVVRAGAREGVFTQKLVIE